MRILVLTINYWPEQTGIGAILTRRCEYLASVGHEITVCTGMPYYPEWRIHPGYTGKLFLREERNGVTILRSWMWVPKKVTSANRVVFEASFLASSLLRAIRNRKPELAVGGVTATGARRFGGLVEPWVEIPYVFDVQDLQPDAAADLGMLPGMFAYAVSARGHGLPKCGVDLDRHRGYAAENCCQRNSPVKVVVVPPPADTAPVWCW